MLESERSTLGAYNLGGTNASGQVPEIPGNFGLIDRDTPKEAYTHISIDDGSEWDLVFSDEFNRDGRSFYPGDDPFWEAVDLHYWCVLLIQFRALIKLAFQANEQLGVVLAGPSLNLKRLFELYSLEREMEGNGL